MVTVIMMTLIQRYHISYHHYHDCTITTYDQVNETVNVPYKVILEEGMCMIIVDSHNHVHNIIVQCILQ